MRHSSHSIALDFYGHSAAGHLLNLRLQVFFLSVFASVSILHLMMSHAFLQICFQTVSKHKPKKNMKKHRRFSACITPPSEKINKLPAVPHIAFSVPDDVETSSCVVVRYRWVGAPYGTNQYLY